MAGCYGNSKEDRHFEAMCDRYTDQYYGEDDCTCEKTETEQQYDEGKFEIDNKVYNLEDCVLQNEMFENTIYRCPCCDGNFDTDEVKQPN